MQFTINYTYQDIYETNKFILKNNKKFNRGLKFLGMLFICLALMDAFISHKPFSVIIDLIYLIIIISILKFLPVWVSRATYKKHSKHFLNTFHFSIDNNGINVASELTNVNLKWRAVDRFEFNNNILIIYMWANSLTIPKRSLCSENNWDQLIELIRNKLNANHAEAKE